MRKKQTRNELAVFTQAFDAQEKGDVETAIRLYKRASRMGSTSAQLNLGNIYDDVLIPAQPLKAVQMYRKAVKLGDPGGAWNLAIYYKKLGKKRWHRYWLRRAASMGEEDAISELSDTES